MELLPKRLNILSRRPLLSASGLSEPAHRVAKIVDCKGEIAVAQPSELLIGAIAVQKMPINIGMAHAEGCRVRCPAVVSKARQTNPKTALFLVPDIGPGATCAPIVPLAPAGYQRTLLHRVDIAAVTPAIADGGSDRPWTGEELVG